MSSGGSDVNHVQFDSFGKAIGGTVLAGFSFGLDGMPYDQVTNLYKTQTVWVDPSNGNRLSQDPIGFDSGTTNLSAYAGENTVEYADPSGMCGYSGVVSGDDTSITLSEPNAPQFAYSVGSGVQITVPSGGPVNIQPNAPSEGCALEAWLWRP